MKKYLIVLVCLLFVKNVLAQDRNANWELKIIEYYADGTIITVPNFKNISFKYVNPEVNKSTEIRYRKLKEIFSDSIETERYKKGKFDKKIDVQSVEFWVKPLRKIISEDTFTIHRFVGRTHGIIDSLNKVYEVHFDRNNQIINLKEEFWYNYLTKQILGFKCHGGYYSLGKYELFKNASLAISFKSTDTTLDNLHSWYDNVENFSPYFLTTLPSKYKWFAHDLEKKYFVDSNRNYFDSLPNFSWSSTKYKMNIDSIFTNRKFINNKIQKQYLERPEELICDSKNNSFIFLMSRLRENDYYQFKLVPWLDYEGKDIPWTDGYLNQCYFELKNVPIGKYILYIKNKKTNEESNGYKITILPLWYQTITFKIICWSLLFLSFLGTGFWIYKRKQKRKLLAVEKQKTQIDIQLKTVRSQLNPHFIFNALSSIQSLISKTDYEKANEYLIDFSQLLRKPLNQENIATWNLNDEIELLKTYIKLEQLRTNFQFDFTIDEHINVHTISFPAMLLQPIVENAIKHGFSNSEQGELFIHIDKEKRTIIITIEDNGNSFDSNHYKAGNGLALTKDYIELVNKQYPHSFVSMNFDNTNQTTKCIFTFKNWIDE
jgi:two-component sensor histidine kinase